MRDDFSAAVARQGDNDELRAILDEVCRITGMGFAAVARVTEDRWIAAQVIDRLEFGLTPGGELAIKTTICDEIRQSGRAVVIDHVAGDESWRTHHTPALYGFESYVSIPVTLHDGTFYGTLCAIDPHPRRLTSPETVAAMTRLAGIVADILSTEAA